jgi:hypothetical protein
MDDLDRMYRLLVRNVRASAPHLLARPFELAEIYQSLIPYRLHRRELGIETNEDYEITMSRLLAGERGYLVSEPQVQQALQRELGSNNPDPTVFRQFAHAQVAFAPDALRAATAGEGAPMQRASGGGEMPAAPPPSAPIPMAPMSTAAAAAAATAAAAAPAPPPPAPPPVAPPPPPAPPMAPPPMPPPAPPPMAAPLAPPPMAAPRPVSAPTPRASSATSLPPLEAPAGRMPLTIEAHGDCTHCGGPLPEGRKITFCPHCGQNLTLQHCPACGTELELGWKFCVTCGRASS